MIIEKLIAVGDDLYSIDITQGTRPIDCYPLDKFRNCNIKIKIEVEKVEVNWIENGDNINDKTWVGDDIK